MSPELIGMIGIIIMFALMAFGMPIAVCMSLIGILGAWYVIGINAAINGLATVVWSKSYDFVLSTVPMFVLMGYFIYHSGISTELFNSFRKWLGWLRGGLAMATIATCALFAAATGSSVASAATMGVVCAPEMDRLQYDKRLSSGAIATGGTLGILIPPSTVFIIYGILTEQSIGALFMAGIIPGILMSLLFMVSISVIVRIKPQLAPKTEKFSFKWKDLKETGWIVALFVLVIGGIYTGVMTPTEAGAVGAFGAFFIALMKRKLTWGKFILALTETLRTTCFIFAIIIGAFILNYFLTITRLPNFLAEFTATLNLPPLIILIFIFVIYLFLGCVMDALAMVVITMPIFFPTIIALGFDPIWFGVIVVIIFEMALITPPIGLNCYILNGVVGNVKLEEIFLGITIFLPAMVLMLILLVLFPELALFLPSTMGS